MPSQRSILRVVMTVVVSAVAIYLIVLLREPIIWIVIALFLAVAASGPVNVLSRHMKRGLAITIVYGCIILAPFAIVAILLPPAINGTVTLVNELPSYVQELEDELEGSSWFDDLNKDYDITAKLSDAASNLVKEIGQAAGALADVGATIVNGLFAGVTILVLSIFMCARGRGWVEHFLSTRPGPHSEALRRAVDRAAAAVGNYIVGAIVQAVIAGAAAFVMLTILGTPSPLALAVLIALFDLIPLVGATIGAVIVGAVTLFGTFPIDTIVWALFAIAYQQFENYVIQPRIQSRAVSLEPFVILVAVLFGGTLFGVIGALLAIPVAASVQIAIDEYMSYRREVELSGSVNPAGSPP